MQSKSMTLKKKSLMIGVGKKIKDKKRNTITINSVSSWKLHS